MAPGGQVEDREAVMSFHQTVIGPPHRFLMKCKMVGWQRSATPFSLF